MRDPMAIDMTGFATGPSPSRAGTTGLTIAAAVTLLALPSAVLGFGVRFEAPHDSADAPPAIASLQSEGGGARLARALSLSFLGHGPLYPFTPAKNPNRPDRSVTVAVRLDSQVLKAITVQGAKTEPAASDSPLRIAQSGFNLGVARGYQTFAPNVGASGAPRDTTDLAARYSMPAANQGGRGGDPRFATRIAGDDHPLTGRAAHTYVGDRDDPIDVGGSYRVTRNIDLTAGLRYSQDRERLKPLTSGNLDSQAVYVGTKFKF